jgi:hypothetical protein
LAIRNLNPSEVDIYLDLESGSRGKRRRRIGELGLVNDLLNDDEYMFEDSRQNAVDDLLKGWCERNPLRRSIPATLEYVRLPHFLHLEESDEIIRRVNHLRNQGREVSDEGFQSIQAQVRREMRGNADEQVSGE